VVVAALAAAYAVENDPKQGDIGLFRGSWVMWRFLHHWLHKEQPLKLVEYEHMLYPQYEEEFEKTIPPDVAQWLREEANKRKDEPGPVDMDADVTKHMQRIADGQLPFGYTVAED
jgi:hypothetical protein